MPEIKTLMYKGRHPYASIVIKPDRVDPTKELELVEKDVQFGLFVLGTEKHESRRIDNQLRGRSGRQWDPGVSQFYVALDDEIMRKMGGDTIKSIAKRLLPVEELSKLELTQSQFTSSITRAQKQMEWYNFSIRKHLFDYDNVVNKQRMRVYGKRDEVLLWNPSKQEDIFTEIAGLIKEVVDHTVSHWRKSEQSYAELVETINQIFGIAITDRIPETKNIHKNDNLSSEITTYLIEEFDRKVHIIVDAEQLMMILRSLYLESIDKYWIEHIDTMQHLREKVGLYGYAQQDPLVIYKQESYKLYSQLWLSIKMEFLSMIFKIDFTQFHGLGGEIDFGQVDTNEEEFEQPVLDMDAKPIPKARISLSWNTPHTDGVEVIDLAAAKPSTMLDHKKVWPNEPCPCGSGKKYKKCHGK